LRQLRVGESFGLFPTYRDKTVRPRLFYRARGVNTLTSPDTMYPTGRVRLNGHSIGHAQVQIEVIKAPVNLRGTLTVVEHRPKHVTMVADSHGRIAPLWSGIRLRNQPPRKTHDRR
jgi:hypothetical protein